MALTKETLAARVSAARRRETVAVPELGDGESLFLLEMMADKYFEYREHVKASKSQALAAAILLVATIADPETLAPIYDWDDAATLAQLPAGTLFRVFDVAADVNGISLEAAESQKKDSPKTEGGASPSDSAATG